MFKRAREILNSPETIHVFHNDIPIWIEKLNPDGRTALVTAKTGQYTVPVDELVEQ